MSRGATNTYGRSFCVEKTLKESERGSICLVRDAQSGHRYIQRNFSGDAEVYLKIQNALPSHTPKIVSVEERNGQCCILEEYIQGDTLAFLLESSALPEHMAADIMLQLCEALEGLHTMGIVHRDIKPENIILRGDEAVLIDFDVSRLCKPEQRSDTRVMGTAGYAAPEQYGFTQTDGRADIYALGVLFNEMLTKQHPSKYLTESVFRSVVEKCIEVNTDKRYASVGQLRRAIEQTAAVGGKSKKKRLRIILPVCLLALAVIGGIMFFGGRNAEEAPPAETPALSQAENIPTPASTLTPEPLPPAANGIYMATENGKPKGEVIAISRKNDLPPWGFWLEYASDSEQTFAFYYYNADTNRLTVDSDEVSLTSVGEHLWKVMLNDGVSGDQTLYFSVPVADGADNVIPVFLADTSVAPCQKNAEVWPGEAKESGTWFAYDLNGDRQDEQYYFAPALWLQLSDGNVFSFCAWESVYRPIHPGEVKHRYVIPAVWSYDSGGMPVMVPEFADLLQEASVTLWRVNNTEAEAPLVYVWEDYGSGAVEVHYLKEHGGTWLYELTAELDGKTLRATGLSELREP